MDDTLIVLMCELRGLSLLKVLLDKFATATGLCINYNKSTTVPIHMDENVVS